MARTPLMAGNWKMNLDHLEANHLVQGLAMALSDAGHDYSKCEVLVIPPFTDIRTVQTIVDADELGIKYGAQDVSVHDNGAYTGEISTDMLTKLGVTYVVMGHSERREYHNESDELVGAKARKVFDAGMTPILCCGEALEVRKAAILRYTCRVCAPRGANCDRNWIDRDHSEQRADRADLPDQHPADADRPYAQGTGWWSVGHVRWRHLLVGRLLRCRRA